MVTELLPGGASIQIPISLIPVATLSPSSSSNRLTPGMQWGTNILGSMRLELCKTISPPELEQVESAKPILYQRTKSYFYPIFVC